MQKNPEYEEIISTSIGTFIDVSGSTSANPYVFPSDGYITVGANGSATYILTKITGSNDTTMDFYVSGGSNQWNIIPVFVRKGMKFYVTTTTGLTLARFSPFT